MRVVGSALSSLLGERGLVTEPFTFVSDRSSLVLAKFEGFVAAEELEAALPRALTP